jgi:carboxyl-terminal processing protease
LILDLRNNPGGVLDQGVAVSDLFLDRGLVVVETRGRAPGATQTFKSENGQRWPDMPIAVLVDGFTASAAEIIAGALQDHDRALVLGTTSFGKGLVQSLYQLNRTEFLKLTTGRWYTPSGRTIQRPMNGVRGGDEPPAGAASGLPDTTEVFRTDGGRVVHGGGGIRPDIMLAADTLSDSEQEFARALGSKIPVYRDVLTSYALELKGGGKITSPSFQVAPEMRAELARRLRSRGVEIPAPVWDAARELVEQQFSYEITRYVFGRPAEFARRTSDDTQVQRAVVLLKRARTPKELLSLAHQGN